MIRPADVREALADAMGPNSVSLGGEMDARLATLGIEGGDALAAVVLDIAEPQLRLLASAGGLANSPMTVYVAGFMSGLMTGVVAGRKEDE